MLGGTVREFFAEFGVLSSSKIFRQKIHIINCTQPGNLVPVMMMKYEDPNMEAYWNSLPAQVQSIINKTGIEICSLGMLMKLGDYYQNGNGKEM